MPAKKISRAEARRQAAAHRERLEGQRLPETLEHLLANYQPQRITPKIYAVVRPTLIDIMRRSTTRGEEKFRKQRNNTAKFLAWNVERGQDLDIAALMTPGRIHEFIASAACETLSDVSRAALRSDLKELARQVNPSADGHESTASISRPRIKPPYTAQEAASIVRVARSQSTESRTRQLCACVGLGLGAGLDSTDLRRLSAGDIEAREDGLLVVHVQGRRARVVPIRDSYVELVQIGVRGLRPSAAVIGASHDRRNVAGRVVAQAVVPSTVPPIEQSRLRATWLAHLLQQPIPILDVLEVAGLRSVQTLVDIARYLRDEQEVGR